MFSQLWIISATAVLLWSGVIVLLLTAVVLAGALYQALGSRRDRKLYTNEGRTVSLGNGTSVYLLEMGFGGPTVIFESGFGATHLNWRRVQESVASFAGTVAYDRAGLGWSDPSKTARTPSNIAAELHETLLRAGIEPPYILVGHSFGGLVMRRYALLYPDEVAGLVLIDPMRCEEWPPLNPASQSQIETGRKMIRYAILATRCGLARFGVALLFCRARKLSGHIAAATGANGRHAISRITTEVQKMPQAVWPAVAAHWSRPGFYAGLRSHIDSIPESVREMHVAEPIRAIPITLLTPGSAKPLSANQLNYIGDQVTQIIAPQSRHWIHLDEPDLVIDSIRTLITASASQSAVTVQ